MTTKDTKERRKNSIFVYFMSVVVQVDRLSRLFKNEAGGCDGAQGGRESKTARPIDAHRLRKNPIS